MYSSVEAFLEFNTLNLATKFATDISLFKKGSLFLFSLINLFVERFSLLVNKSFVKLALVA